MDAVAEELCRQVGRPEQGTMRSRLIPWNRRLLAAQKFSGPGATARPVSKSYSWSEQTTTIIREEETSSMAVLKATKLIATSVMNVVASGRLE